MNLYNSVSKKLGMDLVAYIKKWRENQTVVVTEDDNEENPLSVLTLEELDLFEEYALLTYQRPG